jgi:hypothetical protein
MSAPSAHGDLIIVRLMSRGARLTNFGMLSRADRF